MNRNQEYEVLLQDLDTQVPSLELTIRKARRRRDRHRFLVRTVGGLASCFALFVVLVNASVPVAYACSKIPILRELAQAVTFSPSLRDAVDNEYAQIMGLTQTDNGITAKVEYLIVDQKQVNVFYRLDSKEYSQLNADPQVLDENRVRPPSCSYGSSSFNAENNELRHMDIDFIQGSVPDRLHLILNVYSNDPEDTMETPQEDTDIWADVELERNYLAEFDFLLEFDPSFTATGEVIPVHQILELDGQTITVTEVDIYPSHMRINVEEHPDNTAYLKALDFYVKTDYGMQFEPVSNGITATGSLDSPALTSYRADSPYFHRARKLELVIQGASWLGKVVERIRMDLNTGVLDFTPEGITAQARPYGKGWVVSFRAPLEKGSRTMEQLFHTVYYDPEGREYYSNMTSSYYDDEGTQNDHPTHYIEEFPLRDYPYDEVWLSPVRSHRWRAEFPTVVPIR